MLSCTRTKKPTSSGHKTWRRSTRTEADNFKSYRFTPQTSRCLCDIGVELNLGPLWCDEAQDDGCKSGGPVFRIERELCTGNRRNSCRIFEFAINQEQSDSAAFLSQTPLVSFGRSESLRSFGAPGETAQQKLAGLAPQSGPFSLSARQLSERGSSCMFSLIIMKSSLHRNGIILVKGLSSRPQSVDRTGTSIIRPTLRTPPVSERSVRPEIVNTPPSRLLRPFHLWRVLMSTLATRGRNRNQSPGSVQSKYRRQYPHD